MSAVSIDYEFNAKARLAAAVRRPTTSTTLRPIRELAFESGALID